MRASRLRIIVSGYIAQYPLGGVTWDYVQYVAGLHRLGHDVYYIEDTGQWPYNPQEGGTAKDAHFNVAYLSGVMARFGLGDRWAYRFPWQSQWFGLEQSKRAAIVASAELVINVSGSLVNLEGYGGRLVYIDSDPVFTQIKLARGQKDFERFVRQHVAHFSFGETLPDELPNCGIPWRPTRQPILLEEWSTSVPPTRSYTTVMNWSSYAPVEFDGRLYGQKDVELRRFIELPQRVAPVRLELAMSASGKKANAPIGLLNRHGWSIVDPQAVAADAEAYRSYIQASRAEWSVAKNGYVIGQAGWFSCRSACYLAAGRPVIAQDTGFSRVLPVGRGLFAFQSLEDAVAAVQRVESDYASHAEGAREVAEQYFGSKKVLSALIERAF